MGSRITWFVIVALTSFCCQQKAQEPPFPTPVKVKDSIDTRWNESLTEDLYYDKVLGMLVGSAIGDAMGAPTEMWDRRQIAMSLGTVDTLGEVLREGSPEGPWQSNLPAGSTTDDTRWKYLAVKFVSRSDHPQDSLSPAGFAAYLVEQYNRQKENLKDADAQSTEQIELHLRQMVWLQEWAKVARPYLENNLSEYSHALNKFYGGEMACGGMLYAPVIGAVYPAMPAKAYVESYRLGIFDIGYARDITGLTAAYVSRAMTPGASVATIGDVTRQVDPMEYFDSRLIGRTAYRIWQTAKSISFEMKQTTVDDLKHFPLPSGFSGDTLTWLQTQKAYSMLDNNLQDIPFHAAEIHLINLTALECSGGDFRKAMEFVVNYGRDNDTVAAVTGAILGAYWGAEKLPPALVRQAIDVNREVIGIDLPALARELVDASYRGSTDESTEPAEENK